MKTNYVLIDYENVQVKSLDLLRDEHFRIYVFLGPSNTKLHKDLAVAMQKFGERAEYVELDRQECAGLHPAYFLGALATTDPAGYFHLISKDTGFDPLVQYLASKEILASRSSRLKTCLASRGQRAMARCKEQSQHPTVSAIMPQPTATC
jgi:hypothetical protein